MKKLISSDQCRAARALVNWTGAELSRRSKVPTNTLSYFENSDRETDARNVAKLSLALELGGVRFTDDGGVVPARQLVTVLEGADSNERLLADIYGTLKDTGGEVLIAGLAEADPNSPQGEFVAEHIEGLIEVGVTERILLDEGDMNMIAPAAWYRWLPKGHFTGKPFQAYADKVALIDFGREVVVIDHPSFAANYRAMFDVIWRGAALKPDVADG